MNETNREQSFPSASEQTNIEATAMARPIPAIEQIINQVEQSYQDALPDAEAVINKVIEMAESNHTIERILERKHEVKDLAANEQSNQRVAGENYQNELLSASDQVPGISRGTENRSGIMHRVQLITSSLQSKSLYGYAFRYGLLSAVLAAALAVVTALLLNS